MLIQSGVLGGIAATGVVSGAARQASPVASPVATPMATPVPAGVGAEWEIFAGVPETPMSPPGTDFRALTADQALAVEMLTARILPGTPDDPGAREAGVVYYIDYLLSQDEGFVEATYRSGPWARAYEGDTEPDPEPDVIWVPKEELSRYGYQAPWSPLEIYEIGLAALDAYADDTLGTHITAPNDDQLDDVIWAMLGDEIEQFTAFSAVAFFQTLRLHTAEGMFSDPAYGGNRDMAGWRLVGFPGAQRSYSPQELITEGTQREPQSMHGLPSINPEDTGGGPENPARNPDPDATEEPHDGHD